ncbi:MAG: putative selenium-dependent hydroxylase accessory protein YqeC, partial [Chloroflexi bacterium]|nr:putative selenium-dependent hydroxylase accessory protein YqeC [Chloroflexota bacterium]
VDFVLVEADGSRMRPIKAPASHEPVIPPGTTLVAPTMGIDALDGRIADVAHRSELVCSIIGNHCSANSYLTAEDAATLLTHPQGGLKGAPESARVIPFINKVETAVQLAAARQIAFHILRIMDDASRIPQVVIGAAKSDHPVREVHQRVTAVVLAAGQSKRMGQTKQLLPWGETTVLGQVLHNLKETAVHDILVVTGHEAEKVAAIADEEAVSSLFNPHFAAGEMLSSLQTAVAQLPDSVTAVLVMLADQPMIKPANINRLLAVYWQEESALIAPSFEGRQGNPVLIGRAYFDELLALPPGLAPRHLVRRYQDDLRLVEMPSATVLHDLDSPADYARWQSSQK